MATFILVPGASHTAWCWHKVVPLIERAGHDARPVDLPGTGENRSIDPREASLAVWAQYVAEQVRAAESPVLLTGHSRGGFVISEAAEMVPDELAGLVYVTAAIPLPGRDLMAATGWDRDALVTDGNGLLTPYPTEVSDQIFYNRCSDEDRAEATTRLYPEPLRPLLDVSGVSVERWGRVPRAFIECADDNTFSLEVQRRMQSTAPCSPVITIDADHSPFLSAPRQLAEAMLEIATRLLPPAAT
jgi:pimeloyl-ACP methyl ester carboxylesterase